MRIISFKILLGVLVIAVILSFSPTSADTLPTGSGVIILKNGAGNPPGSYETVTVYIQNNLVPGIGTLQFEIPYESPTITFSSATMDYTTNWDGSVDKDALTDKVIYQGSTQHFSDSENLPNNSALTALCTITFISQRSEGLKEPLHLQGLVATNYDGRLSLAPLISLKDRSIQTAQVQPPVTPAASPQSAISPTETPHPDMTGDVSRNISPKNTLKDGSIQTAQVQPPVTAATSSQSATSPTESPLSHSTEIPGFLVMDVVIAGIAMIGGRFILRR